MKQTLLVAAVTLALTSLAGAANFTIRFSDPVVLNGKELKPGEYKVEVKDTTAVIRQGKDVTEAKVKIETNARKYDSSAVRLTIEGGKNNLDEIHVGGTKTKLVFEPVKTANGGE